MMQGGNGSRSQSRALAKAAPPEHTCCATLPTLPKPKGKSRRAFVDAALALDEISQRFVQVLEFGGVPQHT
jgi:hypothetical protein